jgi:hypothetical protein
MPIADANIPVGLGGEGLGAGLLPLLHCNARGAKARGGGRGARAGSKKAASEALVLS